MDLDYAIISFVGLICLLLWILGMDGYHLLVCFIYQVDDYFQICVVWLHLGMYFKQSMMMPPVIGLPCIDIRDTCGNKKTILPFSPKDTPNPWKR